VSRCRERALHFMQGSIEVARNGLRFAPPPFADGRQDANEVQLGAETLPEEVRFGQGSRGRSFGGQGHEQPRGSSGWAWLAHDERLTIDVARDDIEPVTSGVLVDGPMDTSAVVLFGKKAASDHRVHNLLGFEERAAQVARDLVAKQRAPHDGAAGRRGEHLVQAPRDKSQGPRSLD
jgi:hypothetical protein